MDELDVRKSQPFLDTGEGISDREWILENSRVGGDANEAQNDDPGQGNPFLSLQAPVPPYQGFLMLCRSEIVGVDEEVNVRQNHRAWLF